MDDQIYISQQIYTSEHLINLCDEVIAMLNGTNESVADLTKNEKEEVANSAASIILNTSKNKINLLLNSLSEN